MPAVLVLLLFPTSFFFAAVYTEALLLALSLSAVAAFERRRLAVGALAGVLAGLTRISGLVLAPYLALVAFRAERDAGRPEGARPRGGRPRRGLAPAGLRPLLPVLLEALSATRFSSSRRSTTGAARRSPSSTGRRSSGGASSTTSSGAASSGRPRPGRSKGSTSLLFVVLAVVLLRQRRRAEALYVFLTVAIVFASGTFESAGRYVLPAFPAFAVLAGLRRSARRDFFRALLVLAGLAQVVYVWAFVHGYWAG